jgi:flavin-dependent dehydrogenase
VLDVLIAGAGPAGATAAIVLARAGVRVLLVDREEFPRDTLCGDTVNPGALRALAGLDLRAGPLTQAFALAGSRLVFGAAAAVVASPGPGGLAVRRRDFDAWLLAEAVRAGARFEPRLIARHPLVERRPRGDVVRGLVLASRTRGTDLRLPALATIAADGARSVLARQVDQRRAPPARRWAFGAYVSGFTPRSSCREIHIGRDAYTAVTPLGRGLAQVHVVCGPCPQGRTPADVVRRALAAWSGGGDRGRSADVERIIPTVALSSSIHRAGVAGMLLAGDAAGTVDARFGHGLDLAIEGGRLAALETLRVLETGESEAAAGRLADARVAMFSGLQWRSRLCAALADGPMGPAMLGWVARTWPGARRVMSGDD